MKQAIRFTTIVLVIFVAIIGIILWPLAGLIMLVASLVLFGLYDLFQTKHSILRNFPVIGHMRYLLEMIGPELHQYFVESDTDGKPINKNHRNYIYERAKEQNQTRPLVLSSMYMMIIINGCSTASIRRRKWTLCQGLSLVVKIANNLTVPACLISQP